MCPARRSTRSKARSDPLKKGPAVNAKRDPKPDQTPLPSATEESHIAQEEDIENRVLAEYEQNIKHGNHTEHEEPTHAQGPEHAVQGDGGWKWRPLVLVAHKVNSYSIRASYDEANSIVHYNITKTVNGRRNLDWLDAETKIFSKFRLAHHNIAPIERPDEITLQARCDEHSFGDGVQLTSRVQKVDPEPSPSASCPGQGGEVASASEKDADDGNISAKERLERLRAERRNIRFRAEEERARLQKARLQSERIRLKAERAKLDAERAAFTAEKKKWEDEKAKSQMQDENGGGDVAMQDR